MISLQAAMDLSQLELDQGYVRKMFSSSQPELVYRKKFDIPSPPPVATEQSGSHFPLPDQSQSLVTVNPRPEPPNVSDPFDVNGDLPKAPIASIPELQLDDENVNNSARRNSPRSEAKSPAPLTGGVSVAVTQNAPSLPAGRPPGPTHSSDHKAAGAESVSESNGPCENDVLQQSQTQPEISPPESTRVPLSHPHPEASVRAAPSAHSNTDATFTEPTLAPRTDTNDSDSATGREEVSVSHAERSSFPEAAESVTTASAGRDGTAPWRSGCGLRSALRFTVPSEFHLGGNVIPLLPSSFSSGNPHREDRGEHHIGACLGGNPG